MPNYKKVKLSAIHEDESNARLHPDENLSDIRASLIEFGQVEPLVVQKSTGKIIGGNGRYQVMKSLDWKECDVVYVDIDNTKATALGIALNRAGERAEWDDDVLAELLSDIVGEVGEELQLSLKDLEESLEVDMPEVESDAPPQIDRAEQLQKKWGTMKGQLWLIGEHRLLCGDSTNKDDVEQVMDGKKAMLFSTDPPYLVNYDGTNHPLCFKDKPSKNKDHSANYKDWDDMKKGQEFLNAYNQVAVEYAIDSYAAWYCWHAYRTQRMFEAAWENAGAFTHQQIIWVKTRPVMTRSVYLWQHEPCFFGWLKGKKPFIKKYDEGHHPRTVWDIASSEVECSDHPTSKPIQVFSRPMDMHTVEGDVCYEPFAGSGSQYVAAQNLHRKCYGIEISPAYCAVILERMQTAFPDLVIKKQ